jgi:hypothetical protein
MITKQHQKDNQFTVCMLRHNLVLLLLRLH